MPRTDTLQQTPYPPMHMLSHPCRMILPAYGLGTRGPVLTWCILPGPDVAYDATRPIRPSSTSIACGGIWSWYHTPCGPTRLLRDVRY
eukprot:1733843-Rhodomonas_salina.2